MIDILSCEQGSDEWYRARLGIPTDGAHDALADCRMAAAVMANLIQSKQELAA